MGRETDLEQLERKTKETEEYRKARQLRLGHVAPPEEEKKSAPKKAAPRKKSE